MHTYPTMKMLSATQAQEDLPALLEQATLEHKPLL